MRTSLHGKTALVTGADSRMGKRTATRLAELGARVAVVAPDREQGQVLKQEIRRESGSDRVELLDGDLALQRDVHRVAEAFRERHDRLHLLVHTGAGRFEERDVTEDGIERTFAANYLSGFLLTSLLLEELKAGAPSRIVTVASRAHRAATLDFEDLQTEQDYTPARAFAQAQLATILFTYELAGHLDGSGVTVNCVEPGPVEPARRLRLPFGTARRGARGLVHVAAAPELETVSAECFSIRGSERRTSDETYDPAIAAQLWEASERLVGVMVG